MAKTISKDKGPSTRARSAAAKSDAANATVNDDLRDEDTLASDENVVPDDTSDEQEFEAGGELAVDSNRAVARRTRTEEVETGGVMGYLLSHSFTRYFAESYLEMRKVTWPTATDARNMTIIVIAMSAFVAIVLGVADIGLTRALEWLTTLAH
ncbi:MAG: preprotein translocase subunit SecE [Ktedonobacterales bacterium]